MSLSMCLPRARFIIIYHFKKYAKEQEPEQEPNTLSQHNNINI